MSRLRVNSFSVSLDGYGAGRSWWGDNPPYDCDVFVLTHHARKSFAMEGGTTFHFVTGGILEALTRASKAAGGKDVRVGGGVATIQQYWRARLIDELHLAFAPVFLGSGESLLDGIDVTQLGYEVTEHIATPAATHVVLTKRATTP
jgi:dihydrofolate reductase